MWGRGSRTKKPPLEHLGTSPLVSANNGFVGKDFYDRGIALIAPKLKNPHIFVTSDDIEWCRNNYPVTVLGREYKSYKFGECLTLISRCKHFLIPNSTFTWWAAWLNTGKEKIVVCPRTWCCVPGSDASDLIPEGWVRI
jgi:hypothetical protein